MFWVCVLPLLITHTHIYAHTIIKCNSLVNNKKSSYVHASFCGVVVFWRGPYKSYFVLCGSSCTCQEKYFCGAKRVFLSFPGVLWCVTLFWQCQLLNESLSVWMLSYVCGLKSLWLKQQLVFKCRTNVSWLIFYSVEDNKCMQIHMH